MKTTKISSSLADHLNQVKSDANVEVILELSSPSQASNSALSRQQKISNLKVAFQQDSAPVEQLIEQQGGEVVNRAWINQTLRVRVPANCLDQLSELDSVSTLDIPHSLSSDYGE